MTERVDRTERLLNLVICLMAARIPVPRSTIQRAIPGYDEAASPTAFERMFERDKEELRSMGIPVETVSDGGEVIGYRIPADSYVLSPIAFTVAERAAVALAAQVWTGSEVADVPGTAVRKLESVTREDHDWTPADLVGPIELTAADAALLPLMHAIRDDRIVTFEYRAPDAPAAARRRLSPWGLRSHAGRWVVVGYDHDREAQRMFRLSRVQGPVTVTAAPREQPPAGFDVSAVQMGREDEEPVRARVRLAPRRAVSLRRRAVPEDGTDAFEADEIVVEARSLDELVALVCAAGADAVVVEPAEAVSAVREALESLRTAHVGSPA